MSSLSKLKLLFLGRGRSITPISNQEAAPYASAADFCLVFMKNMDGLYLLSFLLTGEHSLAEKCFVNGLNDSQTGNPVFNEWALSWARRTIIQKAIQMIRPQTSPKSRAHPASAGGTSHTMMQPAEIVNIVGLPQFERFVFVISVLERYSSQECSLLLNCTRGDVIAARTWALQQIARAARPPCKLVCIDSEEYSLPVHPASPPQPDAVRAAGSGLPGKGRRATTIYRYDHAVVTNRGT
jgi:hypothetical protein